MVEEYLDKRGRAVPIVLSILNRGTAPATNVEVRIYVSGVDDVDLDLREPSMFSFGVAPAMDGRQNGSRNVTYESEELTAEGARVIQRVKLIPPGSDAELVTFFAIVRVAGVETPFAVDVVAIDFTGKRSEALFNYTLVQIGEPVPVDQSTFR